MLTEPQKTEIRDRLKEFVDRVGSQNKASNVLKNVSAATLSQIINDNWERVSDEMWRNIASQIGVKRWEPVETTFFSLFSSLLEDAQRNAFMYAVTAEAGSGKSFAARTFAATHRHAYHLVCCESWSLQLFLIEILRVLGYEQLGNNNNNGAMLSEIVRRLQAVECPVLILDEADKLRNQILYSLITLYNQLEDTCGIVLCATAHLETRMMQGVEMGRMGYNELYSRIGRKFVRIPSCNQRDVLSICAANGITDPDRQAEVYNDSNGDLRRVKRLIHAIKNEPQR